MTRQHPQERGPSQRRLRTHPAGRYGVATLGLMFLSTPLKAEICDKVVSETWRPNDGPFFLLAPTGWPLLFILCGGLVLVGAGKLRKLGYFSSVVLVLVALVASYSALITENDIYRAAVQEGCLSHPTDLMNLGLIVVFAVSFSWLAHRSKPEAEMSAQG